MKTRKNNEGFTLIELLVTLAAGSLVTIATISLLLLGTRIQHGSSTDVKEQQTVRVVLSLLEEMAGSGQIEKIVSTYGGWQLCAPNEIDPSQPGRVLFEYVATEQAVYTGEYDPAAADNVPLLTGLNNAGVTMEGKLMRLSFETDRGEHYVTRVYCRTANVAEELGDAGGVMAEIQEDIAADKNDPDLAVDSPLYRRLGFLEALAGEYKNGVNTGRIQNPIAGQSYDYYSQWYIGSGWGSNGWNKDTPWCACFTSWAAVKSGIIGKTNPLVFANVDTGMAAFQSHGEWHTAGSGYTPVPGDYIFFDWSGERKDPAHVGVVLDVTESEIFTIEGNSSNRVAVRKYSRNEKDIMGYGILPQFLVGT